MTSVLLPWKADEGFTFIRCFYEPLSEMLFSLSFGQKTKDAL